MPYQTQTIFGTGPVQYDDADRAAQAAGLSGNDAAVRLAIARMASGDNRYSVDATTGTERYGIDAKRAMFGDELKDKALARQDEAGLKLGLADKDIAKATSVQTLVNQGGLAEQRERNAPQMEEIRLKGREYDDQSPMRTIAMLLAKNQFEQLSRGQRFGNKIDDMRLALLNGEDPFGGAMGGAGAGGGAAPAPAPAPGGPAGGTVKVLDGQVPARAMPAPAPGAAGGMGDDLRRAVLYGAFGAQDPSVSRKAAQAALGEKLLANPNLDPKSRAFAAALIGQSDLLKGMNVDPDTLAKAYSPQQKADTLLSDPAVARELDQIAEEAARGTKGGGSEWGIHRPLWMKNTEAEGAVSTLKPRLDALIQSMVQRNVPEAEARAAVSSYLEAKLPQAGFGNAPIESMLGMLPGVDMYGSTGPGIVRTGLGLGRGGGTPKAQ